MRIAIPLITLTLAAAAGSAFAGPKCDVPQERWMKENEFRAMVEKQGLKIQKFKVSSGQCYEIYGRDAAGKKVEIYYDPATGAELQRKAD